MEFGDMLSHPGSTQPAAAPHGIQIDLPEFDLDSLLNVSHEITSQEPSFPSSALPEPPKPPNTISPGETVKASATGPKRLATFLRNASTSIS
jgi:hypothetical protein